MKFKSKTPLALFVEIIQDVGTRVKRIGRGGYVPAFGNDRNEEEYGLRVSGFNFINIMLTGRGK